MRALVLALHLLQPASRLAGRLGMGLTVWRRRGMSRPAVPRALEQTLWSERWSAPEERLAALERALGDGGAVTRRGGPFDRWDLQVRGGIAADARVRMLVEEHGAGRQLVRFRVWPRWRPVAVASIALPVAAAIAALAAGLPGPAMIVLAIGVVFALVALQDAAVAVGATARAVVGPRSQILAERREHVLTAASAHETTAGR